MHGARKKTATVLALVLVFVAGCSSGKSPGQWLGLGNSSAKEQGTFFAGVDGLTVRDAPNGSAKVLGELALHQKVIRSKVSGGYALVRVAGGNLSGWVVNSKLLWKLPSSQPVTAESPAAVEQAPEAVAEPPAVVEEPPAAAEEPPPPKSKSRAGASVFDPY